MSVSIYDAETGETSTREMTPEEKAQQQADAASAAKLAAETRPAETCGKSPE